MEDKRKSDRVNGDTNPGCVKPWANMLILCWLGTFVYDFSKNLVGYREKTNSPVTMLSFFNYST